MNVTGQARMLMVFQVARAPGPRTRMALAVQEMFGMDPFCGAAFVFRAKRADRIKLLLWDQTGMVLVHKRLEGGKFVWPQVRDGVMRMSSAQFAALFEGVDWRMVRPERARRPLTAG